MISAHRPLSSAVQDVWTYLFSYVNCAEAGATAGTHNAIDTNAYLSAKIPSADVTPLKIVCRIRPNFWNALVGSPASGSLAIH
jgi:hypothetical protein